MYISNLAKALLVVAMVFLVTSAAFRVSSSATPAPQRALGPSSTAAILEAYGQLPLSFEANQGQTDKQVKFMSRGSGYNLFLTPTEAVLSLRQAAATEPRDISERVPMADVLADGQPIEYAVLRMQLVHANPTPQVLGLEELPGKVNYFIGNDPAEWRTDIATYAKVAYQDVYSGVDLIYYGNQGQLEYDFVVAPGADPASIALGFAGADSLAIDAQGELVLRTAGGEIRQQRPLVYQELGGVRQEIAGRYVINDQDQVGIAVDAYDPSRPLVIDPVLVYSTYLGGSGGDQANGIAVDSIGNAYVTGLTFSSPFPTTSGAFDTTFNGGTEDAFVTKLDPAGAALVYSTYLGGSAADRGNGIAVDSAGSAYVTGTTNSGDFPTTLGAFDTSFGGNVDAFVTKLNPAGSALVYSTYLGGIGEDRGFGIAVDSAGSAYVTGLTEGGVPTTPGTFDTTFGGFYDVFVTKFTASGSALGYSTFVGGGNDDRGLGIAVDSAGSAYVTGQTVGGVSTTPGAFDTSFGGGVSDIFVTKLNPAGSALVYSTFVGGTGNDFSFGIAVDSAGSAYVTGTTTGDFPTTSGAFDTIYDGTDDAFVTKLNPAGSALSYSTYLGGSNIDQGNGIAVDSAGSAYVTGGTNGAFPTTPGAFDTTFNGLFEAFVTKLDPSGGALVYSTYLGGSNQDFGNGIAVDSAGSAYVTGRTDSNPFPTTPGAFDTTFNGVSDAFVTKLSINAVPAISANAATVTVNEGQTAANSGTVSDADGDTVTLSASVGAVVNNGDGTWSWSLLTTDGPASQTVTITADDGNGGTSSTTFGLTVNNVAPTVNAGPDQSVFRNDVVTLSGSWSDPAAALDNPYTWSWDLTGDFVADDSGAANYGDTIVRTTSFVVDGVATLTFAVTDQDGATSSDTVQITVVNRTPVANNQTLSTNEDTPLPITLTASDADNDTLTYSVLTLPLHGALSGTAPNLTYTPDPDYFGPDSFTFKVNDGLADSNIATISLGVTSINDPAVALDDSALTGEETPVTIAVQANDSAGPANENQSLTTSIVSDPPYGTVVINPNGSVTYTPDLDYNGPDSFTYTVCDAEGSCATATVMVLVDMANDPPVANDDSGTTPEDTALTLNVLANDSDVDGNLNPGSVTVVSGPTNGTLVHNGNGSFTYTPAANFSGSDSFSYEVCDSDGVCDTADVLITVTAVNDAPVCSAATPSVALLWPPNHQFEQVTVSGVTDEEGNAITISIISIFQDEPTNGTGDGDTSPDGQGIGSSTAQVRAERNGNGNGRYYHISFSANDGNGGTCTGTVKVNVPKNQGKNGAAVDNSPLYNSTLP